MTPQGRKSPLGTHGWISSAERREAAISGHSPIAGERLLILNADVGAIRLGKYRMAGIGPVEPESTWSISSIHYGSTDGRGIK